MNTEHMQNALRRAVENVRSGNGGPFAALVVRGGQIIAYGTNGVTSTNDPTAHAEIVAIRTACSRLGHFQLDGCTLYTTCEPCPMCMGAVYWSRLDRVYFACTRQDAAAAGFDDAYIYDELARPIGERTLPLVHCPVPEAERPFDAWKAAGNKTVY